MGPAELIAMAASFSLLAGWRLYAAVLVAGIAMFFDLIPLPEHLAIIEALEARDTELAEKRARDHTLGLAAYVEAHGQELFS